MFDLPVFEELIQDLSIVIFDQCGYGAKHKKPTQIVFAGIDLLDLEYCCDHEGMWQFEPATGRRCWLPHPVCLGKE